MNKTECAISYAEKIAADNIHGYSQVYRWPEEGSSFDCSSLVIYAWQQAGVPVRDRGATFTGNMYSVFMSTGFIDVTNKVNLQTGEGLVRGDVCLNDASHTIMYCGNGKIVHARSSEGTSDQRDNSGNEIRVQSYWNFPWNHILRYKDSQATTSEASLEEEPEEYEIPEPDIPYTGEAIEVPEGIEIVSEPEVFAVFKNEKEVHICRPGEYSYYVYAMQELLWEHLYCPTVNGYFTMETADWVIKFQEEHCLEADAECGELTWNALFFEKDLRITCRGYAVYALQYLLKAHNYFIYTDGIFGTQCYEQLKKFQSNRGLTPNGICDNATWNELIIS